jgi:hypothetical protein
VGNERVHRQDRGDGHGSWAVVRAMDCPVVPSKDAPSFSIASDIGSRCTFVHLDIVNPKSLCLMTCSATHGYCLLLQIRLVHRPLDR